MLNIRPLRPWDAVFCWRLAHDTLVRESAVDRTPPTIFGHLNWMAGWLWSRDKRAWVVSYQHRGAGSDDLSRAALVCVERRGFRAVISIEVLPEYRGRGVGQRSIAHAVYWVLRHGWGVPTAYIRYGNFRSQTAFEKVGFRGAMHRDGWVKMEFH